jgi:hypothetical protein
VAELLMSIRGSSLANAELAEAVEVVIYRACMKAATYAADLVQHAGALQGTTFFWPIFGLALGAVPACAVQWETFSEHHSRLRQVEVPQCVDAE